MILPSIECWRRDLGSDTGVSIFAYRSQALWVLGYSEAALADANSALKYAREIDHAATLMYTLHNTSLAHIFLRKLRGSRRTIK